MGVSVLQLESFLNYRVRFIKTSPKPGDKLQMGYKSIMRPNEFVSQ